MSFIYRTAVSITRKQPYVDWANSFDDDGPELTLDLAQRRDTIYLVGMREHEESLAEAISEWWADIFEEELAGWRRSRVPRLQHPVREAAEEAGPSRIASPTDMMTP